MEQIAAKPLTVTSSLTGSLPSDAAARLGIALHWLFRLGMLMEFTGHGSAGISLKEGWVRYFGVFGFDEATSLAVMPIVGAVDVALAILAFVSPRRWALLWCAFWGFMTAWLRPLSGESIWEVLDRAGNYGGPLAFLLLSGWPSTTREWFEPIRWRPVTGSTLRLIARMCQWITVLVLIGHGAYNALLQKPMLLAQYSKVGLTSLPFIGPRFEPTLGWFEIVLGIAIAIRPLRALVLAAFVYKIATELLYPITGYPLYEFVERGFTYVAPLALFFMLPYVKAPPESPVSS